MFKWNYRQFMPFYAPDTGADGGQVGGESNNSGVGTTTDTTDYKALLEKAQADLAKAQAEYSSLKKSFDTTASELSAKKKAEREKMSEEEKRAAETAEREKRYQELQNEVYEMRVSTAFAKAGFDEKDYGELVKQVVEIGGEKASEFSETLIEFIKKANKSAVANARNGAIKDGAVTPKTSTGQTGKQETKSDYQLYQEGKTKTNNIVEL